MAIPTYSTGTVSVNNLGTTVTGVGGMWSGINAREGDFFTRADGVAVITEVTDATHLKITPWPGATVTGGAYAIQQNYVGRVVGVAAAEDVGVMLEKLHTDGLPFIVGVDETVPDPSYGDEGQMAFKPTTGQWWVKSGGVWVPSAGIAPAPRVSTSSSPPVAPVDGDLWWEDDTGILYIYYTDATPNSQWVMVFGGSGGGSSGSGSGGSLRYDVAQQLTLPQIATAQSNINMPAIHRRPIATWLPKWGAARAKVIAGVSNATVLIVGDSTSLGSGAGFPSYPWCWPTVVAAMLTSAGINASWQSRIADGRLDTVFTNFENRVVMGGSYVVGTNTTLGGTLFSNLGTISTGWQFTPTTAYDTAVVYTPANAGLGSLSVKVNTGTPVTINENSTLAFVKTTVTGPLAAGPVLITPISGTSLFMGVVTYNSAVKEVSILNAGISGGAVGDFVASSLPWEALNAIGFIAPDLTIIDLTVNDASAATASTTYQTNLELIIAKAKLSGDVIFVGGAPTITTWNSATAAVQQRINNTAAAVAAKNSINFVSFVDLWKSRDDIIAAGYDSGDGIHLNSAAYQAMAAQIAPLLL